MIAKLSCAFLTLIFLCPGPVAYAAWECNGDVCDVFIPGDKIATIATAQRTAVWCWAASLETLFKYYGHDVPQTVIVSRFFGGPAVTTGNPLVMKAALNMTWIDVQGHPFSVRSQITDSLFGISHDIDNIDIVNSLKNNKPVFFGNNHHAMIMTGLRYRATPGIPIIMGGWVIDPYPGPQFGIRRAQPDDLRAYFAAITNVQ